MSITPQEYNRLHEPLLKEICTPVAELGFDTFFYTRIFLDQGYAFSLCTNLDYAQYFWNQRLLFRNDFANALRQSLAKQNYKLLDPKIDRMKPQVFNIISIFDAFEGKVIENWGFASSSPIEQGLELCINNECYFRRFLNYFKYKSRFVIAEGIQQKALYYIDTLRLAENQLSSWYFKQPRNLQVKKIYIVHGDEILSLSNRQVQCLFYMSKGYSIKETAKILDVAPISVEGHINRVKSKTHCHRKLELINIANKNFVDQLLHSFKSS